VRHRVDHNHDCVKQIDLDTLPHVKFGIIQLLLEERSLRPITIFLTIVCALAWAGLLGTVEQSSSGQEQNIRKQPACTMYCGDGPDTFSLGAKPCWGGPLPANGAGDHYKSLSEEDQAGILPRVMLMLRYRLDLSNEPIPVAEAHLTDNSGTDQSRHRSFVQRFCR
jgi:hypothetical protein